MQVRFVADWHRCWIGFFADPVLHRLYVMVFPMLGICFIPGEVSNQQSRLRKLLGRKEIIYRNCICRLFGHKMKAWTLDRRDEVIPLQTCQRCGFTKPPSPFAGVHAAALGFGKAIVAAFTAPPVILAGDHKVKPTEPLSDPPPPRGRVMCTLTASHCSVCGNRLTVECGDICSTCTQKKVQHSQ